jgi:26S proteasome regulatory subunit N12
MEGAYNKVFAAREVVPAPSYLLFVDVLTETIRTEIADCCAKAYERILVTDAAKLLHLSPGELEARLPSLGSWRIEDGHVIMPDRQEATQDIPSEKVINRSLDYARDLERII